MAARISTSVSSSRFISVSAPKAVMCFHGSLPISSPHGQGLEVDESLVCQRLPEGLRPAAMVLSQFAPLIYLHQRLRLILVESCTALVVRSCGPLPNQVASEKVPSDQHNFILSLNLAQCDFLCHPPSGPAPALFFSRPHPIFRAIEFPGLMPVATCLHLAPSPIAAPTRVEEKPVAINAGALSNQIDIVRSKQMHCRANDLPEKAVGLIVHISPYPTEFLPARQHNNPRICCPKVRIHGQ